MILKALYDYYNRILDYAPNSVPSYGFQNAKISFVIIIRKDGAFVRIEDCRNEDGKGKEFVLPKGKHTNSVDPFLFWDNCQYAINYSKAHNPLKEEDQQNSEKVAKWEESLKKAQEKHNAFVMQCKKIWETTHEPEFYAVVRFYETGQLSQLKQDVLWQEIKKNPTVNVTFRIDGQTHLVSENKSLVRFMKEETEVQGLCLITGKRTNIIRTAKPTPLKGCKSSASLVTFQTGAGYDSYGKSQCYNAPISSEAEFAYSAVLLKLIAKDSRNKFETDDRTFVFWASSNSEAATQTEESIFTLLDIPDSNKDDPDAKTQNVIKVFEAVKRDNLKTSLDDKFYILGLAPNRGRIAVVYWAETTLKDFAEMILRHFKDMEIVGCKYEEGRPYRGLKHILSVITKHDDKGVWKKNITPNLPEAIVKSIFQGTPYHFTIFSACIRRIRAESSKGDSVSRIRAGIIKAYLNRLNDNNKKIQPMLDKDNDNPGYLCGRLFAVLEGLQKVAYDYKRDTIRASYMNAASSSPATVFPTILKLSNIHYNELSKERGKLAYFFDNEKKEIIAMLKEFPATLSLNDQGRFFLGYYHQKNYKNNDNTEE